MSLVRCNDCNNWKDNCICINPLSDDAVLSEVRVTSLLKEIIITTPMIKNNVAKDRILNLIENYKSGDDILHKLNRKR